MREKLISRNFKIMLVIGIILTLIGIWSLNEASTYSVSGGNFLISSAKNSKAEYEMAGTICLLGGIALCVVSFLYKNNAKANTSVIATLKGLKNGTTDEVSKLKELKKLYDEKVITKEEYESKKKDILNKM